MSTAKFCIKHKVTTLLAVIMIAIFGLVFTTQLQMALLPNMEYPAAVVICYYNGASPSDMEELVTRPLEAAVMSVPGVDEVQSVSSDSTTRSRSPMWTAPTWTSPPPNCGSSLIWSPSLTEPSIRSSST